MDSAKKTIALLIGLGLASSGPPNARAAGLSVKVPAGAQLMDKPGASAASLGKIEAGSTVEAVGKGPGGWIQVKQGNLRGWVKRSEVLPFEKGTDVGAPSRPAPSLRAEGENVGGDGAAPDDEDEEAEKALREYDTKSNRKVAARKGRLYESPSTYSQRFGLVEVGDQLQVQRKSDNGQWSFVRLNVTGEEGWYPTKFIKIEKTARLGHIKALSLELEVGYATNDYSYGGGLGVFYNFAPGGFAGRPRDRFEVGMNGHYFAGASYAAGSAALTARYLTFALLGRYVAANETGFLSGAVEGGLAYARAQLTNAGFSDDLLSARGLGSGASGFRPVLGAQGMIASGQTVQYVAGGRAYIGSTFVFFSYIGIKVRF